MKRYLAALAGASMAFAGCTSDSSSSGKRGMTNMETEAIIGAVGGAVVGAVAYKKNRTAGAVGAYMDSQKKDLEKNLHKEIQAGSTRVDKMPNDLVRITMTNQTAFDTNSTTVKPGFYATMDKVADVVIRYGKTTLTVVGHTDNKGTAEHNQNLSEQRALPVRRTSILCVSPLRARARAIPSPATIPNPVVRQTAAWRSTSSRYGPTRMEFPRELHQV